MRVKTYNKRRFKKLLQKEFGERFDVKAFNILTVGTMINNVNTTCGGADRMKVKRGQYE